jgi:hypothetical protein
MPVHHVQELNKDERYPRNMDALGFDPGPFDKQSAVLNIAGNRHRASELIRVERLREGTGPMRDGWKSHCSHFCLSPHET